MRGLKRPRILLTKPLPVKQLHALLCLGSRCNLGQTGAFGNTAITLSGGTLGGAEHDRTYPERLKATIY